MLGWIIFAVFAVMGVLFWTGKGGWLIAGYNTASAEEKKKYDEKKLNRTMAKGWTIIPVERALKKKFDRNGEER